MKKAKASCDYLFSLLKSSSEPWNTKYNSFDLSNNFVSGSLSIQNPFRMSAMTKTPRENMEVFLPNAPFLRGVLVRSEV